MTTSSYELIQYHEFYASVTIERSDNSMLLLSIMPLRLKFAASIFRCHILDTNGSHGILRLSRNTRMS